MAMKLAIFGDSYADTNGDNGAYSWPNIFKENNDTYIKGLCGTSVWNSYTDFMEYVPGNNPDTVIFCHTNPYRWPSLPKEIEGQNWNIHSLNIPSMTHTQAVLNQYYLDIFPEELSRFIAKNVFQALNDYCKSKGIYLVNLVCFDDLHLHTCTTEFPVITNLIHVSNSELVRYNDKSYTVNEMIEKFKMVNGDPRICHLGNSNNNKLANIITELITNKRKNIKMNANTLTWHEFDESNDKLFEECLEYYK
jgi:hypothetical protein